MLTGGAGDDVVGVYGFIARTLDGGSGNDLLTGGSLGDVYRFAAGFGQDIVSENGWSHSSRADVFEFDISFDFTELIVETAANGADMILRFDGADDRVVILDALVNSNSRIETVTFAEGVSYDLARTGCTRCAANCRGYALWRRWCWQCAGGQRWRRYRHRAGGCQ